ncbi:amidohydrolase [Rhizobium sp. L245/93]|uniref:amidohydrolase family protein n=1 Tax=Rhizobium sp. L245/93 TaxID=2819998 RepID=UPI001ADCD917|nr:amidohydrolase [Rhizobium sp. L245/93]MBO9170836.1 amidohydrolase [Rhizobium sp. L245/93]
MPILIRNGRVLTNDAARTVHDRADILVEGEKITAIGQDIDVSRFADIEIVDASKSLVMPGFVDAHMHSNEGFEMGRYDNLPLEIWLSEVYPPFNARQLSWEEHYLRAMLVAIVSVRSGVTTLQDDCINMFFDENALDATAAAYRDIGLRASITSSMWDHSFLGGLPFLHEIMPDDLKGRLNALPQVPWQDQIALFKHHSEKWHEKDGIRIILGPCGPQRCSDVLMHEVAIISAERNLPIHCHVLETKTQAVTGQEFYGTTLVQHLKDVGVMTHRLTMNHAIWLTEKDIEIMGAAGCSTTHNPLANLKLGSGVSPIRALKSAGVNVALGCDGVASADTADIFHAVKAAAMLHKIGSHDYTTWVSAHEAYEMATHGGARSAMISDRVGALKVGMDADIILLDRYDWGFLPLHDPIQQIAFSVNSDAVKTSLIRGRIVMRDRELVLVDAENLRERISQAAEHFRREDCPRMSEAAAIVRPYIDTMYNRAISRDIETLDRVQRSPPLIKAG